MIAVRTDNVVQAYQRRQHILINVADLQAKLWSLYAYYKSMCEHVSMVSMVSPYRPPRMRRRKPLPPNQSRKLFDATVTLTRYAYKARLQGTVDHS